MTGLADDNAGGMFVGDRYPDPDRHEGSRSRAKFSRDVEIPSPGEEVPWDGFMRSNVPRYILRQLREAAHRMHCTRISLILQVMAAYRDAKRERVFYIRPEDLVPDRRKVRRACR